MSKQFAAIVVVVVLGLFGVFALTKKSSDQTGSSSSGQPSNHALGAGKKGVTLIEYGDLECPACKAYHPLVKQIKAAYGDDIKFQFRHFPLNQIHPNAFLAARAAEAAGKQGKFFEMHDLMYGNQEVWKASPNVLSEFETFAKQLGLNIEQYKADLASEETNKVINADIKAGQAIGANSTPTFVINGRKIEENPKTIDEFKKLIDEEIKKSTAGQ